MHIKDSSGYIQNKSCDNLLNPWKFDIVSEEQFLDQADTGDIILFRGNQTGSSITRTFTQSHFDHIAMVLKFDSFPEEVYIVEATGNMGVSLNKWNFLKSHIGKDKFYQNIVCRHVKFLRGQKMINNLETFLGEVVGQKYGLSKEKLMKQQTDIKSADSNTLIDEDRTFFCSELIAKAFKLLGVIEEDETSCTQFWPHHFSSKGDHFLNLTEGTFIGPEM